MICILSEKELTGWDLNFIQEKCARVGLGRSEIDYLELYENDLPRSLKESQKYTVCVSLGERPLTLTSGHNSLSKWHLSPLDALPGLTARKVIPTFSPSQIKADWTLSLYLELALKRAREEHTTREYDRKPKRFLLNPDLDTTLSTLRDLRTATTLSVDIETGRGQINTVGFAWSASDAIAINVLPERCSAVAYKELWSHIGALIENDSRKICQNGIYEILYFSRYGLTLRNFHHDTMVAQKFLWPELEKGLDNVGRIYTREPYWKDDGRAVAGEGTRKDWGNIRDWPKHYDYNCKDTSNTLEATVAQRRDLAARGQLAFFDDYLMKLHTPLREMCLRGLPLLAERKAALTAEFTARAELLTKNLTKEINPRSSKQKLLLFREKGYAIPKKRNKKKGTSADSLDALSLKKLRIKHPDDTDIKTLLELAHIEKQLSSYLRTQADPLDGNVRFSLDPHGTETGRWAGYKDPWDRGFNPQTIPDSVKMMIGWPL